MISLLASFALAVVGAMTCSALLVFFLRGGTKSFRSLSVFFAVLVLTWIWSATVDAVDLIKHFETAARPIRMIVLRAMFVVAGLQLWYVLIARKGDGR